MTGIAQDSVCSLLTKLEMLPQGDRKQFIEKVVRLQMLAAKSAGFWSAEIVPPLSTVSDNAWSIIQRFDTRESLSNWRSSTAREQAMAELTGGPAPAARLVEESVPETDSEAATAIVTHVREGMEQQYFDWEVKIQTLQALFGGYRGTYLQPPSPGRPNQWATLLRFDSPESLKSWFHSEQRQKLLLEANEFVKETKFRPVSTSFPGWVPLDSVSGKPPGNWKTAMLVLLGLFPIVMIQIKFVNPHLHFLNPAISGFCSLVVSVSGTTWGTMPFFVKRFSWWLFPKAGKESDVNLRGSLIIAALYALEVFVFSNLF